MAMRCEINIRYILVMLIALINVYLLCLELNIVNNWSLTLYDFVGQWQLTAYTLQGLDPYPLIGKDYASIASIGAIPKGWGTSPWGLLLGNIFYPGFMSLENAKIYFIVINMVLLCITALCVSRKLSHISKRLSSYSFICILFSFWFFHSLEQGNAGGGICCLLLLSIFYYDTHPVLAGILLGLSLIKPQISLIVCIAFLILKNYKIVFISFSVVGLSLLAVSGLIHNNPIYLMYEFLNAGIGGNDNYSGIFTLLLIGRPFFAMFLSMVTGVIIVAVFAFLLPKNLIKSFYLFPACLVASFWSYSFYNDFYIFLLPLIVSIYSILYVDKKWLSAVSFFGALYLSLGSFIMFYCPSLIYKGLNIFCCSIQPTNNGVLNSWFIRSLFEVVIIFWAFLQCYILKNTGNDICLKK